jgi:diacylglycerol kinase
MKGVNLVLAFVTVVLCLLVGAALQSWVLLGMSLGIALGVFILNKKLEQRTVTRIYKVSISKASRQLDQYEEIHAPDFFN